MVEELPEVLEIGKVILIPDETFYYTAWGIRYRFKSGDWRIASMAFRKKSDADDWMKENIIRYEGMEGTVLPVKRCLLLEQDGKFKTWVEELS